MKKTMSVSNYDVMLTVTTANQLILDLMHLFYILNIAKYQFVHAPIGKVLLNAIFLQNYI